MNWKQRFKAKEFLKNSLWLIPVVGVAIGVLLKTATVNLEEHNPAPDTIAFSVSTASA